MMMKCEKPRSVLFDVLSWHSDGGNKTKIRGNPVIRVVGLQFEISTQGLRNTKQGCHPFDKNGQSQP
jgi:hypothetical protein